MNGWSAEFLDISVVAVLPGESEVPSAITLMATAPAAAFTS
jgi:hypothetical protein